MTEFKQVVELISSVSKQQESIMALLNKVVSPQVNLNREVNSQVVPQALNDAEDKEAEIVNKDYLPVKRFENFVIDMHENFSILSDSIVSIRKELESLSLGLAQMSRQYSDLSKRVTSIEEDEGDSGEFDNYKFKEMDETLNDHEDRLDKLEDKKEYNMDYGDREDFDEMRQFYFAMKNHFKDVFDSEER